MIGMSRKIKKINKLIESVSLSDCNVLILGETGTGKELAANQIHLSSQRSRSHISHINCSAIPENLIESELFGHTKGAFTGAICAREGKIKYANGGTIFLDEIGDMSIQAQAKILRVLESSEIQMVGSDRVNSVNVRWVAATNNDLLEKVKRKQFRDDLYYRLKVAEIILPPLREHREDINILCDCFIKEFNCKYNKKVGLLSDEAVSILLSHSWPGNVRELKNAIEFTYVNNRGSVIEEKHLPEYLLSSSASAGLASNDLSNRINTGEKDKILNTLLETKWNKSRAAKKLNWSRMTLYRKMRKHEIETI